MKYDEHDPGPEALHDEDGYALTAIGFGARRVKAARHMKDVEKFTRNDAAAVLTRPVQSPLMRERDAVAFLQTAGVYAQCATLMQAEAGINLLTAVDLARLIRDVSGRNVVTGRVLAGVAIVLINDGYTPEQVSRSLAALTGDAS